MQLRRSVCGDGNDFVNARMHGMPLQVRFSVLPNDFNSKEREARKRVSVVQSLQEYLLVYALPYDRFERNQRQVKQRLAVQAAMGGA